MLLLFESSAGYAIYELLNEKKLKKAEGLFKNFESVDKARNLMKLKEFSKFKDTPEALEAATAAVEGKMSKKLKKLMKKLYSGDVQDELLVADAKLGNAIKDKFGMPVTCNTAVQELMRGLKSQLRNEIIDGLDQKELTATALGLAHSLSRYKLKFNPDKVDTMIVQAICLLDELDKELNNYCMRTREWYGWHFPEMSKIITDNLTYAKVIYKMGMRTNCASTDFSDLLPEEIEAELKEQAEMSMGSEINEMDIINIKMLCFQVIENMEYRNDLNDYLKDRMHAIAPNTSVLVGELVGARLIAHAGSLVNLAKHPSSTVQILGAEKALFRALKTKHDTPKYGLIYHASLVGQSNPKMKGKMSRMLAAKVSLNVRLDAYGEDVNSEMGITHRAKLERKMQSMESGNMGRISGTGKAVARAETYQNKSEVLVNNPMADSTIGQSTSEEKKKKKKKHSLDNGAVEVKVEPTEAAESSEPPKKKKKKDKKIKSEESMNESVTETESTTPKKKSKKRKSEALDESSSVPETPEPEKKKKKKKSKKIKAEADD